MVGQLFFSWGWHTGPVLLTPTGRGDLGWVSSLRGLGTLLEDGWWDLIPTDGYRRFGDCMALTLTLLRSLQAKHGDQQRNPVCSGPCLHPPYLQACPWCLSPALRCHHCSCAIHLHPGPRCQPDHGAVWWDRCLGAVVHAPWHCLPLEGNSPRAAVQLCTQRSQRYALNHPWLVVYKPHRPR